MYDIPQDLLKLTDKELHKLLDKKNSFTAKYLVFRDERHVYRVIDRCRGFCFYKQIDSEERVQRTFINDSLLKPLTFKDIEKYKKNKITSFYNTCSNESFIKWAKDILYSIYEEDRVDIIENVDYGYTDIVIYYPEIVIKNSVELEHTMKDLYVRYTFSVNNDNIRVLENIAIARTTYVENEVNSRYCFSHRSGNLHNYESGLCFGETPLKKLILNCKLNYINIFNYFEQLFLSIDNYLSWESLEGTPYNYISKINEKGSSWNNVNCNYFTKFKISQLFTSLDIKDLQYEYNLVNGRYVIKLTDSYKDLLDNELLKIYPDFGYVRINGKSVQPSSNSSKERIENLLNQTSDVIFKGKRQVITVIENKEEETNLEYKVHVDILNYYINLIETRLTEFFINNKLQENE